jgi:hypothetical protein
MDGDCITCRRQRKRMQRSDQTIVVSLSLWAAAAVLLAVLWSIMTGD